MRPVPPRLTFACGFTLTEMAMVLFIIALLMGSLMLPLSAQDDARKSQETAKTLSEAQNALLGFAAAKGRLPCPASATSNGLESYCTNGGPPSSACGTETLEYPSHGRCSNPFDGFLPAAALGTGLIDANGFGLDGWNNAIRYAVTPDNDWAFTKANGMSLAIITNLKPDLRVCAATPTAGALTLGQCSEPVEAGNLLTNTAVAVLYSLGPNGPVGGKGTDEAHNPNPNTTVAADRVFISHERTAKTTANPDSEFDDIVVWLSPNILYNRMIAAGRLP